MKFRDYYETLGVTREASQAEIQKAYRKLARKFHPDVNKAKGSEDRFKQINEANEVLGDPEKRKRYDALGANWQSGQEFRPPPGFEGFKFDQGGGGASFSFNSSGGFSDFFDALFGNLGGGGASTGHRFDFGAGTGFEGRAGRPPMSHSEVTLELSIEDLYRGGKKRISLQHAGGSGNTRTLEVAIPPGTTNGTVIRLAGQGSDNPSDRIDLLIRIKIVPSARWTIEEHDMHTSIRISPSEAALGGKVPLDIIDGSVVLAIPPGTQSGSKLRVKGKGLKKRDGTSGDIYVELSIGVPKNLSAKEREIYEELQRISTFRPRGGDGINK